MDHDLKIDCQKYILTSRLQSPELDYEDFYDFW